MLQRTESYPYGEVRYQSDYLEDYSWTGQERDQSVGLSYHSARYLDTWSGRWISPDPLFLSNAKAALERPLEAGDLYGYVANSPLRAVDPTGRDAEFLIGGPYDDAKGKEHPYGHVALRVHGNGYDKVYDFGRYGRVWGTGDSEGQGVLRVWEDSRAYLQGEKATGRVTKGYDFSASANQDRAIMSYFDSLTSGLSGANDGRGRPMTQFVLRDDYHALRNNCTTLSIDGFEHGQLGVSVDDKSFADGRGLGFKEKLAAGIIGWPDGLFMPADLGAKLDGIGGSNAPTTREVRR